MNAYLFGLHWELFEGINGIYVTNHHIRGWRYFSTYKNGESKKQAIFQKLAQGGMRENRGDWDWHHVVEGNHLAPLCMPAEYDRKYDYEWPTVLLHSAEEHKIYNRLFRSKGTLFGLEKTTGITTAGDDRQRYVKTLYERYSDIYTGDPILQTVAGNVIRSIA